MVNWIVKGLQFVYNYRTLFNLFVKKPDVVTELTMEQRALAVYNQNAKKFGVRPVELNDVLVRCAMQHAEWMNTHNKLSHVGALSKTARERVVMAGYKGIYVAEDIFICSGCDGDSAIHKLMKTLKARSDIIENFNDFGIGRSGRYWCVILGR